MNLLINASAAKSGGAHTIIERYINEANFNSYNKVVLIAPSNIKVLNNLNKVTHIPIATSGIMTFLFSVFFVYYYYLLSRCDKLISFNNISCLFKIDRVNYFHNMHILLTDSSKNKLYRFYIKIFQRKVKFIFQTSYVEEIFNNVFGSGFNSSVKWPGLHTDIISRNYNDTSLTVPIKCLIPISDVNQKHKNMDFIIRHMNILDELKIELYVLDADGPLNDRINYIGFQSKESLLNVYNGCDLMIFPSEFETVGLPIFEFAIQNKPVLVLNRRYLSGLTRDLMLPNNIICFEEQHFRSKLLEIVKNYSSYAKSHDFESIVTADWDFD